MVDIYLRSVPSDSDSDDVRLYDPTTADAGGSATASGDTVVVTTAMVDGVATGGAVASGGTVTVTTATVDGIATGAAAVAGDVVVVTTAMVDGTATGTGGIEQRFQGAGSIYRRGEIKALRKARKRMAAALERHLAALVGEAEDEAAQAAIATVPPPEAAPLIAEARAAVVTLADLVKIPTIAEPPFSVEYVQDLIARLEDFIAQQDEDESLLLLAA